MCMRVNPKFKPVSRAERYFIHFRNTSTLGFFLYPSHLCRRSPPPPPPPCTYCLLFASIFLLSLLVSYSPPWNICFYMTHFSLPLPLYSLITCVCNLCPSFLLIRDGKVKNTHNYIYRIESAVKAGFTACLEKISSNYSVFNWPFCLCILAGRMGNLVNVSFSYFYKAERV